MPARRTLRALTLRVWFPPSPSLPGAPVREGPGTGPGCSVSDPLAELTQSASPGAERSGTIRFVPELVQRENPVWDERDFFLSVGEYLFVSRHDYSHALGRTWGRGRGSWSWSLPKPLLSTLVRHTGLEDRDVSPRALYYERGIGIIL